MDAHTIIKHIGMNPDPAFYAGRGATTVDLNSARLELIHDLIRKHVGVDAASNFVSMVRELPQLSAETFLSHLYFMEQRDWRWSLSALSSDIEIISSNTVGAFSNNRLRDETSYIRSDFLEQQTATFRSAKYDPFKW